MCKDLSVKDFSVRFVRFWMDLRTLYCQISVVELQSFFQKILCVINKMRSSTKSLQELHRIIQGTDDILNRRKFDTNWRVHRTYVKKSGRRDRTYSVKRRTVRVEDERKKRAR